MRIVRRNLLYVWPGVLLVLASCASTPLDTPEALALRGESPIPRAISLSVVFDDEEDLRRYGGSELWEKVLTTLLADELNVSEALWRGEERRREADLAVTVRVLRRAATRDPRVSPQGALLQVVAWTTVPLVPLWIDDVAVDPGVRLRVEQRVGDSPAELSSVAELTLDPLMTHMLERYPFWSWQTFGAILVPPFIFSGAQDDRLTTSIAEAVRLQSALQVALELRESARRRRERGLELLTDLHVGRNAAGQPAIFFFAGADLASIEVLLEKEDGERRQLRDPKEIPHGFGRAHGSTRLSWKLAPEPGGRLDGDLLRIVAVGRTSTLSYTLRVPEELRSEASTSTTVADAP